MKRKWNVFSNYNGIQLEINNDREIAGKYLNTQKLNGAVPNNPWVRDEFSREILKIH